MGVSAAALRSIPKERKVKKLDRNMIKIFEFSIDHLEENKMQLFFLLFSSKIGLIFTFGKNIVIYTPWSNHELTVHMRKKAKSAEKLKL